MVVFKKNRQLAGNEALNGEMPCGGPYSEWGGVPEVL